MADLNIPQGYGLWAFTVRSTASSHDCIVTLGFQVDSSYTQAHMDGALTAFANSVRPLHDSSISYPRATALLGNDGPALRFETTGTIVGSRTVAAHESPQISYLVKKTTGFAGRAYRGRMYIPFPADTGVQESGALTSGELTLLTTAAAALETNMVVPANTGAVDLRLLHADTPSGPGAAPTFITSLAASGFVATQRRRLERG